MDDDLQISVLHLPMDRSSVSRSAIHSFNLSTLAGNVIGLVDGLCMMPFVPPRTSERQYRCGLRGWTLFTATTMPDERAVRRLAGRRAVD